MLIQCGWDTQDEIDLSYIQANFDARKMEDIMQRFNDIPEISIVRQKSEFQNPPQAHIHIMPDLNYVEAQLKDTCERKKKGLKPRRLPHPNDELFNWD